MERSCAVLLPPEPRDESVLAVEPAVYARTATNRSDVGPALGNQQHELVCGQRVGFPRRVLRTSDALHILNLWERGVTVVSGCWLSSMVDLLSWQHVRTSDRWSGCAVIDESVRSGSL
jgi:hypothetical protein